MARPEIDPAVFLAEVRKSQNLVAERRRRAGLPPGPAYAAAAAGLDADYAARADGSWPPLAPYVP